MTKESHLKILLRALQLPTELLLELSRDWTFEFDVNACILSDFKSFLLDGKLEHSRKRLVLLDQWEVALNFSTIFNLNGLLYWLIHKHITKIDLLLSKVSFGADTLTLQF